MSSIGCSMQAESASQKHNVSTDTHAACLDGATPPSQDSLNCNCKLVYEKTGHALYSYKDLEKIMNGLGWYASEAAEHPGWIEYKFYRHVKWKVVVECRAWLPFPNYQCFPRAVLEKFANVVNSREQRMIFSVREVTPKEDGGTVGRRDFFSKKCNRLMQQLARDVIRGKGPADLFIPRCRFTWQLHKDTFDIADQPWPCARSIARSSSGGSINHSTLQLSLPRKKL